MEQIFQFWLSASIVIPEQMIFPLFPQLPQTCSLYYTLKTYFPRLVNKNSTLLAWPRLTNPKTVASGPRAGFKIACSKAWGAISTTTAFDGTCFKAS